MARNRARLGQLLFATSNSDKFLQARLLLVSEGFDVRRLEAHSRAYPEPYGLPREAFLQAGLDEVVARAGGSRLVFIEDTTVRLHGLSTDDQDFPGQQTKEWFLGVTHSELIESLDRSALGDRRVSVRSDIALYVPGLHHAVFFAAITGGHISDVPADVDGNPLYPWLGKKDFSSWFVPEGADKALALMSLEESLQYDFRAKALRQLAERLCEYDALATGLLSVATPPHPSERHDPQQLVLFPGRESNLVLVVVGPKAAGKTTIGHHLALNRNFVHVEGSQAVAETAARFKVTADSSFDLAVRLFHLYGNDVVERENVVPHLSTQGPIVYTGCRTLEGLLAIKRSAAETGRSTCVLYVTAPGSVRLARAMERARAGEADPTPLANADAQDRDFGLMRHADLLADAVVRNESALGGLLHQVDRLIPRVENGWRRTNRRRDELTARLRAANSPSDVVAIMMSVSPDCTYSDGSVNRLTPRADALARLLTESSTTGGT